MKITLARTRATRALVLAVCVVLLMVQPLRSVWLSLVLPKPWASTDAVHLYKVLTDFQNIPLDKEPMQRQQTGTNPRQLIQYVHLAKDLYPEFWTQFQAMKAENESIIASGDTTKKLSKRSQLVDMFKPLLNDTERGRLLLAFETFHEICQREGLTYFMIEASLMGVIRHHGLIPWDDDIDVAMSVKDWIKIRDVLGNVEGFELFPQRDKHWKFYSTTGEQFKHAYFYFPYIDIFFFDEDESHIWAVSKYLKHDLVFPKSDIFPLQYRPFEGVMVPVPCNLREVVLDSHDVDVCVTPAFVHKTNAHNNNDKIRVKCELLHEWYPFVFETGDARSGKVEERLMVGQRVVHTMELPVGCAQPPMT